MSEVKIYNEEKKSYTINLDSSLDAGLVNDNSFSWDVLEVKKNSFSIIKDDKSYNVELLDVNAVEKRFIIKVNGLKYNLNVKDKYDELLHSLGMDNLTSTKVSELKAPMPGLVLDISVGAGESVSKGDALLILEAMKMENVIKSPTDGVIKSISVDKGNTVEKNQLILSFE